MDNISERLEILIKKEGLEKLKNSKVIVFGLGGVGSFAVEGLARSFIGTLDIVDFDIVDVTNINRQIEATILSVGKEKVEEIASRINIISPCTKVKIFKTKLCCKNINTFNLKDYDYVLDAIDDIHAKKLLINYCAKNKIKLISSMGMANKINPEKIRISKLKNTKSCALARKLRTEKTLKSEEDTIVVYSEEVKIKHNNKKLGSVSFVPSVAGLMMASYVVRRLLNLKN